MPVQRRTVTGVARDPAGRAAGWRVGAAGWRCGGVAVWRCGAGSGGQSGKVAGGSGISSMIAPNWRQVVVRRQVRCGQTKVAVSGGEEPGDSAKVAVSGGEETGDSAKMAQLVGIAPKWR
ncbi:hypothetical protein [Alicyclobacillus sp. ALC3]|uniref:hypothetical protein n=1 Tax=Alicyclobacillus sp. ALC3 TaxID=2796143 RepID=UPI0023797875|nr:hypothetical protein [Alicyclobacillus sp. ALC3]WDL98057.1 hypothetical protein JC200_04960 [Alicyclobacillus sp. ALC3]